MGGGWCFRAGGWLLVLLSSVLMIWLVLSGWCFNGAFGLVISLAGLVIVVLCFGFWCLGGWCRQFLELAGFPGFTWGWYNTDYCWLVCVL